MCVRYISIDLTNHWNAQKKTRQKCNIRQSRICRLTFLDKVWNYIRNIVINAISLETLFFWLLKNFYSKFIKYSDGLKKTAPGDARNVLFFLKCYTVCIIFSRFYNAMQNSCILMSVNVRSYDSNNDQELYTVVCIWGRL